MRITTEQLKAVLGSNEILKGIDFQAQDNEFVGIIGPNGSGKSTLLRCLYRVLEPTQGAVYLDGKALSSYRYQESAKRISVVAQHNYYNFDFTVREVVMMGRAPHKKALDRDNADDYRIVRESLRKVGMQDFEDRSFSTLSGGEQQRIILARALAQQTPCLILDEPTRGIDIGAKAEIQQVVLDLASQGMGVVFISSELEEVVRLSDDIEVLKDRHKIAEIENDDTVSQATIVETIANTNVNTGKEA